MLTDYLEKLRKMSSSKRVAMFLSAASVANDTLKIRHPNTFNVCDQAIQNCKDWLAGGNVDPEILAEYLDAEESDNPWMRESLFNSDPEGLNALVFITMVIGHVAHLAYVQAGKAVQMSEVVGEADENIFEYIVEYGERYGLLEQHSN